jgi:NAD(P)-dependent dehydrogenase (short-subunit alcohol dehydrogenase family)
MQIEERTVVVTGAAGGIGSALVRQLTAAGAQVAATDLDGDRLAALAEELDSGLYWAQCDVSDGGALTQFLEDAAGDLGTIDICIVNAGIAIGGDPITTPDETWDLALAVNVRQHVAAAQALLPAWLARGEGYFVSVASAAGLLTQIGSAPYSVSKHAAVAFAEWLSVTYGSRGVRVSCVCPMGVDTEMLNPGSAGALEELGASVVRSAGEVLAAETVATDILEAIEVEQFLVLPHPEVLKFFARKANDYERWLAGMRRLQDQVDSA